MTAKTSTPTANRDTRVIDLQLMPKLRIQEAAIAPAGDAPAYTPVLWIQEKAEEDGDAAVVLPEPLKSGQKYLLKTTYKGTNVLDSAGDGNYTIGARTSWYANAGVFDDTAMFDLTFRFPRKNQIIAVGNEVSNKEENGQQIAVWKTTHPVRVAGFNYGKFKKMSQNDKDSGVTVEVYTNTGEPDIIREINRAIEGVGGATVAGMGPVRVDTGSLAQSAFADGANTARVGKVYFGGLIDNRVVETMSKVPGIGDLPVLGKLFRSRSTQKSTDELLVVITPHFVRPLSAEEKAKLPDMPAAFLPAVAEKSAKPARKGKNKQAQAPANKDVEFVGPRGQQIPK